MDKCKIIQCIFSNSTKTHLHSHFNHMGKQLKHTIASSSVNIKSNNLVVRKKGRIRIYGLVDAKIKILG